jgi:hypothetical protein
VNDDILVLAYQNYIYLLSSYHIVYYQLNKASYLSSDCALVSNALSLLNVAVDNVLK